MDMNFPFSKARWHEDSEGVWLSVLIPREKAAQVKQWVKDMPDKLHQLTVKLFRQKRSLDANAYCWKLCTEISKATGISKDDVYRRNIREGNEYYPMPIKVEAVAHFSQTWACNGTGWFVDVVDNSKLAGYKHIHAYYGSSAYDTKQMSSLIDRLVQDAKAVGVEVLTVRELELIKEGWDNESTRVNSNKNYGGKHD